MLGALYRIAFTESRLARRLRHRRHFPGLAVHDLADLSVEGSFSYGPLASVGASAIVQVPAGARLVLGAGAYIGRQVELAPGGEIEIGARTSIQDRCVLLGSVRIGRYCTLAYGIYASSGDHAFDQYPASLIKDQDRSPAPQRPVAIEDDCWIGNGVFIGAGVRIGKGAVVGANSVVTRDVPPYTVVAGAPARMLRHRLEFRPPKSLSHDRVEDLPYFYAGFRVADEERRRDRGSGGLIADGAFELALNTESAARLKIRARRISGAVASIRCAGVARALGGEFSDLEFPAGPLAFEPDGPGEICVERAWVE